MPGSNIVPLSGDLSSGGQSVGGGSSGISQAQPSQPQPQGPQLGGVFQGASSGPTAQRILQPLASGASSAQSQLSDIGRNFYSLAGPQRSFESVGGTGKLQGTLQTGQGIDEAKALVGAQYQGPTELDQMALQDVYRAFDTLRPAAQSLSGGGGLQSLVGQAIPGLSPGEARFEAGRLSRDPEFRSQANQTSQEIQRAYDALVSSESQARGYASDRAAAEKSIAEQSRGFLEGQRESTLKDIDASVASAQERNTAVERAMTPFSQSGSLDDLRAIPQETLGFDPEAFATPDRARLAEAQTAWDDIMKRYNVDYQPGLGPDPGITARGEEERRGGPMMEELNALFSPGTDIVERGKYADVLPLHWGEGAWQPADLREYINWSPGVSPSRENVSTEDQRNIINRVNEIMDVAERLAQSDMPYLADQISGNVDKFLEDEAKALDERRGRLDQQQEQWRGIVAKARRANRKRKKSAGWQKVASIVMPIISGGAWGSVKGTPGSENTGSIFEGVFD